MVLTGRRSFRRIPPARLDICEYYQPDRGVSDATYSTRAALIEGWHFDCSAFGVNRASYATADPAMWLALETAARALAGAGLTDGAGLNRDRTGVIIGNSLGGDVSRANAMRVRWPYVRRVLTDALSTQVSDQQARAVLERAERRYLVPFPAIGQKTLAGSTPGMIAATISSYFRFRGGSQAIDSACSSSLQAVASACSALMAGDLDTAIAGGVDISLDPFELIGLAKSGVLATGDVRIYDEHPTGYLPAEGCGMVVLMRTADARAAGLPVYAEIVGWGASSSGGPSEADAGVSSQLLAMRRAYERAGLEPAEVQLFEGNGAGTKEDDDAELAALEVLRKGARQEAVLGSVKANIGHAKAAAGAAGLIKTVLSLSTGVLPPATGVGRPNALINGGTGRLVLPRAAQEWPAGNRIAAVSALDSAGSNVHLVLRAEPAAKTRHERWSRTRTMPTRSLDGEDAVTPRLMATASEPKPFLLQARDQVALATLLSRVAYIARWLSDAELQDLACMLAREPAELGTCRAALVAAGQDQLAARAAEAAALVPGLSDGLMTVRPGIFAADGGDGRVALLLSDEIGAPTGALPDSVSHCLETLRWLESLDVQSTSAVGHGLGALTGLAWAGVLGEPDVIEIAMLRAQFLQRSRVDGDPSQADAVPSAGEHAAAAERPAPEPDSKPVSHSGANGSSVASAPDGATLEEDLEVPKRVGTAALRAAIAQKFRLGPPRRRLIATMTGAQVQSVDDAIDLICRAFTGADKITEAVSAGANGATLMLETGPGTALTMVANEVTAVPTVSLRAELSDPDGHARAAAALFAAGALGRPQPLFAGWPSRPIDIWRERAYISSPCELRPKLSSTTDEEIAGTPTEPAARKTLAELIVSTASAAPAEPVAPAEAASIASLAAAEPPASPEPASTTSADAAAPATPADPAPSVTAHAAADNKAGDGRAGLSALRGKFERRLPDHPLIAAATGSGHEDSEQSPRRARVTGSVPDQTAGLGRWVSCFSEVLLPADHPARPVDDLPWRVHVAGPASAVAAVAHTFRADSGAARTLAVIGDPADKDCCAAAVRAARDAIATGQLVVLTTSPGYAGFFASLHAEHPELGVTVLRIPNTGLALSQARPFAYTEPGSFRELVLSSDGSLLEPTMSELPLTADAEFPLGPQDVVLISRGTRGAGLVLAQVLACCGTPVAVIGRATDSDDSELVSGLEQLRSAGARVGYEVIDIANPASLAAAVERIEDRLGPVTAIGHAVGAGEHVPLIDRTDAEFGDHLAAETATLDCLVRSVRAGQLRMIVTFGSVVGRYGMAGESMLALGGGALAARAEQLAAAAGNCRSLHIDIPAWSTTGLGDRPQLADDFAAAGTAPIDVAAASRLLLKLMRTPDLPDRLVLHGRVSGPAARTGHKLGAAELAAAGLATGARFLQDVQVHYPGRELVCAPQLSLQADPYLADYRIDGLPVLPPVLALEALAQAASVLAGRPVRMASNVRMDSPIAVPAGADAELRICALRTGSTITVALRCRDSSFSVDHARAEFSADAAEDEMPYAQIGNGSSPLSQLSTSTTGLVDGAEMYGPISFQSGRFRRIALLPEVTARSCRALARGGDQEPWFDPGGPLAESGFVLGSPGLNDASLQAAQACVPHRRMRPTSCESVVFSGKVAEGAVEIRAIAVPDGGSATDSGERTGGPGDGGAANGNAANGNAANGVAGDGVAGSGGPHKGGAGNGVAGDGVAGNGAAIRGSQTKTTARHARHAARGGFISGTAQGDPADGQLDYPQPRSKRARRSQRRNSGGDHRRTAGGPARPDLAPGTQAAERSTSSVLTQAVPAHEEAVRSAGEPHRAQQRQLADQLWDIEAVDAAGDLLIAWRGVHFRDAGPLPRNAAWPPSLLSVYLERGGCDLGLDAALRVTVSCGQPEGPGSQFLATAVPRQAAPSDAGSARSADSAPPTSAPTSAEGAGRVSAGRRAYAAGRIGPAGSTAYVAVAAGTGPLAGFSLTAGAAVPVACGWIAVEAGRRSDQPSPGLAPAYSQLRSQLAEPPATLAARLQAIGACLAAAGRPGSEPASCVRTTSDGWALVETATARIACTVVEVSGVSSPVAIAIMTGQSPSDGLPANSQRVRLAAPGRSASLAR